MSVDHFDSQPKEPTYISFVSRTSGNVVGGCIFVDNMSGYIHVEHQLGFLSSETIRAKQNYEKCTGIMELWSIRILLIMASSKQFVSEHL